MKIAVSSHRHLYNTLLYGAMKQPFQPLHDEDDYSAIERVDLIHLHWPEHMAPANPSIHTDLIRRIQDRGIPIVWTQHNLTPHTFDANWPLIYSMWRQATTGFIHHSEWGMKLVEQTFYPLFGNCFHAIIPHLHWGPILGDQPGPLHDGPPVKLGIVGHPRDQKDIASIVRGFSYIQPKDVELHIFSLDKGDYVQMRGVHAERFRSVSRAKYNKRMADLDMLILPFRWTKPMLTTGLVGDVIGAGKPAFISDWPFLKEIVGPASICYGQTDDDFATSLQMLDWGRLPVLAQAARAMRPFCSPETVARHHRAFFDAIL